MLPIHGVGVVCPCDSALVVSHANVVPSHGLFIHGPNVAISQLLEKIKRIQAGQRFRVFLFRTACCNWPMVGLTGCTARHRRAHVILQHGFHSRVLHLFTLWGRLNLKWGHQFDIEMRKDERLSEVGFTETLGHICVASITAAESVCRSNATTISSYFACWTRSERDYITSLRLLQRCRMRKPNTLAVAWSPYEHLHQALQSFNPSANRKPSST